MSLRGLRLTQQGFSDFDDDPLALLIATFALLAHVICAFSSHDMISQSTSSRSGAAAMRSASSGRASAAMNDGENSVPRLTISLRHVLFQSGRCICCQGPGVCWLTILLLVVSCDTLMGGVTELYNMYRHNSSIAPNFFLYFTELT